MKKATNLWNTSTTTSRRRTTDKLPVPARRNKLLPSSPRNTKPIRRMIRVQKKKKQEKGAAQTTLRRLYSSTKVKCITTTSAAAPRRAGAVKVLVERRPRRPKRRASSTTITITPTTTTKATPPRRRMTKNSRRGRPPHVSPSPKKMLPLPPSQPQLLLHDYHKRPSSGGGEPKMSKKTKKTTTSSLSLSQDPRTKRAYAKRLVSDYDDDDNGSIHGSPTPPPSKRGQSSSIRVLSKSSIEKKNRSTTTKTSTSTATTLRFERTRAAAAAQQRNKYLVSFRNQLAVETRHQQSPQVQTTLAYMGRSAYFGTGPQWRHKLEGQWFRWQPRYQKPPRKGQPQPPTKEPWTAAPYRHHHHSPALSHDASSFLRVHTKLETMEMAKRGWRLYLQLKIPMSSSRSSSSSCGEEATSQWMDWIYLDNSTHAEGQVGVFAAQSFSPHAWIGFLVGAQEKQEVACWEDKAAAAVTATAGRKRGGRGAGHGDHRPVMLPRVYPDAYWFSSGIVDRSALRLPRAKAVPVNMGMRFLYTQWGAAGRGAAGAAAAGETVHSPRPNCTLLSQYHAIQVTQPIAPDTELVVAMV
ncbi:hypothetical protein ACA910_015383 [Epithemia clementina (nom. ined.)]